MAPVISWQASFALLALTLPLATGQRNDCTASEDGWKGAKCIKNQGPDYASAFCSSFLPITTPVRTSSTTVTDTTTRTITSYTDTTTLEFSPPATSTVSVTATFSSTVVETSYLSIVTSSATSFVATTSETITSFSNVYTCSGDPTSPSSSLATSSRVSSSSRIVTNSTSSSSTRFPTASSISLSTFTASASNSQSTLTFPTTSKNATAGGSGGPTGTISTRSGTGIIGTVPTGTGISSSFPSNSNSSSRPWTWTQKTSSSPTLPPPYAPTTLPPYVTAYGKEKRQIFGNPRCLRKLNVTSGLAGISDACNCLDIATPTPITSIQTVTDPSATITDTTTISTLSTDVTTPTITATESVNRTILYTDTITRTTSVATTVPGTLTITRTSLSVITGPSPTPTSFNIYYTSTNSTTAPANFFQAGPAPGGSGIVLASENQADFFSVDGNGRLVDLTAGRLFMAKNTQDLYPFALLQTTAQAVNTPLCSACGGKLECDFPGTEGNVFALCYGFLSLGPRSVFGQDADGDGDPDCVVVDLRFK